jgi:hypothetical protein
MRLNREHDKKIEELKKKEKKAFIAAVSKLKESAKNYERPTSLIRAMTWVWNGFSGVLAAIITTVLVGGVALYFSTEEQKETIKQQTVESVYNKLTGE